MVDVLSRLSNIYLSDSLSRLFQLNNILSCNAILLNPVRLTKYKYLLLNILPYESYDKYVYFLRAVNKSGEAICKTSLVVEAYEYIPDSELGHMTGSEEDLLEDKTISEGFITSDEEDFAPKIIKKLPEVVQTKDGHVTR